MAVLFCLVSCKNDNVEYDGNLVSYTVKAGTISDDYAKYDVQIDITKDVFDKYNLTEGQLKRICTQIVRYGDFGAKYKMSYELYLLSGKGFGMILDMDDHLLGSISGSCENAFGVRYKISTYIPFTDSLEVDASGIYAM